ncbi:hypothetical protein LJR034_009024 [Caballeronia sp. LjRoot34]|uniref:hypothetical protein n=1 Tax=Caballeronia sp. LjRoot34 TaxID=3342325 RepID=UPI003ED03317
MSSLPTLEVFQDLSFTPPDKNAAALRAMLVAKVRKPWYHDTETESRIIGTKSTASEGIIVFKRERDDIAEAAIMTLWPNGAGGFKVTNIVPRDTHSLNEREYNAVLRDFTERVVRIASPDSTIDLSPDRQSPLDWTSKSAADALWHFSISANKLTGSAHPSDQQQWMHFIVSEYKTGHANLTPSRLAHWLAKAAGWSDDVAQDLAIEFETAIALLKYYDKHRE